MHYICKTCLAKFKKGNIPCQAAWNKLDVDSVPPVLESFHKLEKIMISRGYFLAVLTMPKGQMTKIKGLPRGADSNGLISVKLKRKLTYCGHVLFEPVCPGHV